MPSHTQSEKAKNAKKRAGGRGNRAARTAGAIASGAAAGAAVGGVARAGSRAAGALSRARPARSGGVVDRLRQFEADARARPGPRPGGVVDRVRALVRSAGQGATLGGIDPGSTIRSGEARAARGAATQAVSAQQAGAIQPPHNSPAMSSFKNVGGISGRK